MTLRARNAFERKYIKNLNAAIDKMFIITTYRGDKEVTGTEKLYEGIKKQEVKERILECFKAKLRTELLDWSYILVCIGENKITHNIDYIIETGKVEVTTSSEISDVIAELAESFLDDAEELLTDYEYFNVVAPNDTYLWTHSIDGVLHHLIRTRELKLEVSCLSIKEDNPLELDLDEVLEWKRFTKS